jgi:hypothetical protein
MVFPLKPPFSDGYHQPTAHHICRPPPMRCGAPAGRSCERPKPPQNFFVAEKTGHFMVKNEAEMVMG